MSTENLPAHLSDSDKVELRRLRYEIAAIESSIRPLQERLSVAKEKHLALMSPFKAGDVITWKAGKWEGAKVWKGQVITPLAYLGSGGKWLVKVIKKDGSFGCNRDVYDWDHPQKVSDYPYGPCDVCSK